MMGRRSLLVFGSLLAREVKMTLHYRWWLAMMQLSNIVVPAISLLVWQGAMHLGARPPVSASFLTTYLVIVSVVTLLTSSWTATFLATSIRLGGLSSWLVRPCSTHLSTLANNVAEKSVKLILLAPMIVVLALAFRENISLPTSGARWALFVVAATIGGAITFLLDIAIGSLAFWVEDVSGLDRLRNLSSRLLSGAILPLALFPESLSGFLNFQPFRFMVSFPIETLLNADASAIAQGFLVQVTWLAIFAVAARALWRKGMRSYQGAGA